MCCPPWLVSILSTLKKHSGHHGENCNTLDGADQWNCSSTVDTLWKAFTTPRVTHQTCFCYVTNVAALTESIQGMPPGRPLNWRGSHQSGSCLLKRKVQCCQVTLLKINILQYKYDWQQWQYGNSLTTSDFWSQEIAYLWSVISKHAISSMNDRVSLDSVNQSFETSYLLIVLSSCLVYLTTLSLFLVMGRVHRSIPGSDFAHMGEGRSTLGWFASW